MMTYQEATEYLFDSAPMFQNIGGDAYKEGLHNTHTLDAHFHHPHTCYRTIHVAGTNGKGSTSHSLAAVLMQAGYKVGLYTSPHLVDFRERIKVNGEMIPQQRVVDFVKQERGFFEPLHPSFFELTTALAFTYFAEQKVDVAVIEVGLGGRLDCTNIIRPDVCVITNISFDHVQFLGNTLEKIASEKAGIIKPHTPVVIGETTAETKQVFQHKALECSSLIYFTEELLNAKQISFDEHKGCTTYRLSSGENIDFQLGGLCQEKNLATILTTIGALQKQGYHITQQDINEGLAQVCSLTHLNGRWQIIQHAPLVVCDTAHNVAGLAYIAKTLKAYKKGKVHIVAGMVSDKDVRHVLQELPHDAIYYFTRATVKRAMDELEFTRMAREEGLNGTTHACVREAYEAALACAHENDCVFVGGSTFIVADFLAFLQDKML